VKYVFTQMKKGQDRCWFYGETVVTSEGTDSTEGGLLRPVSRDKKKHKV
jgi:hypothetical protein